MAKFITIANRKGGVGKSTVAILLAQAFSIWGHRRVLLVDMDSQCNASIILVGGDRWHQACLAGRTIADCLRNEGDGRLVFGSSYLIHEASDLVNATGLPPALSLLPGSILLDDVEGELFLTKIGDARAAACDISEIVKSVVWSMLRQFEDAFDLLILDSAPGLSLATQAALDIAGKVIVPFRTDFVSQMAVDRVALLIEGVNNMDELARIPFKDRRYVGLANFVRGNGRDRIMLEEIGLLHPLLDTFLPYRDDIAAAFDWLESRSSLESKYGTATADIRKVYEQVESLLFS